MLMWLIVCLVSLVSAGWYSECYSPPPPARPWTVEEMESAIPRGPIMLDNSTDRSYAAPAQPPCLGSYVKTTDCGSAVYSGSIGKVYFSLEGLLYVCSGGVGANNLVWTAGHCVYKPGSPDPLMGVWATNWIFVPNFCGPLSSAPQYAATAVCANLGWKAYGTFNFDYALVKFADAPFAALPQLTVTIVNNPAKTTYVAGGYPHAPPFDGNYINQCTGKSCARDPNWGVPFPMQLSCDSTGGSSGGPWAVGANGIGSVVSYGYSNQPNRLYGPYFDDKSIGFFNEVNV